MSNISNSVLVILCMSVIQNTLVSFNKVVCLCALVFVLFCLNLLPLPVRFGLQYLISSEPNFPSGKYILFFSLLIQRLKS